MNPLNALLARIEASQLWVYFHKDWLLQIRSRLRPQLPPEYSIFVESEAVLVTPIGEASAVTAPDVAVARPKPRAAGTTGTHVASAAVIEIDEPCELHQTYTLVIRRAPENRLVAVIEMLSPTNKGVFGPWDRDKYLGKRAPYLESGVNLLEIDALLGGQRLLPPSLANLSEFPRHAWTAFSEASRRRLRGWGWGDADPPPSIDWFVDSGLAVLVSLERTLREAAEFNPWEALTHR